MKRSSARILTTHAGSLPRPTDLLEILHAKDTAQPYDKALFAERVRRSVAEVVHHQAEIGIDIIGDGEHSKSSFAAYGRARIAPIVDIDDPPGFRGPTRDSLAFPAVYDELRVMNAARSAAGPRRPARNVATACTGPVRYTGEADVAADIDNLRAALAGVAAEEAFITAISPTNLAMYHVNRHYRDDDAYLEALADAIHVEYKAIVDAGFVLQIDDPRIATHYNRVPGASVEECRRFIARGVEAINHALRGIPEDRVRFHTCYSVNIAPRVHDLELRHFIDLMLKIKAQAFSFEAANPRHEHEWQVWQEVKLPADRILIPGVVSHCVHLVEHPELVAQRIVRYAKIVGRENVIAGTDCGFATSAAGDEVHPDVAWAKLAALVEGARLASGTLWGR